MGDPSGPFVILIPFNSLDIFEKFRMLFRINRGMALLPIESSDMYIPRVDIIREHRMRRLNWKLQ